MILHSGICITWLTVLQGVLSDGTMVVVQFEDEYRVAELELMDYSSSVMPWKKSVKGFWRDASFCKFQVYTYKPFTGYRGEQPILLLASLSFGALCLVPVSVRCMSPFWILLDPKMGI